MSYICETCNKLFGRKGNLDAHVESVHLEIKNLIVKLVISPFVERITFNGILKLFIIMRRLSNVIHVINHMEVIIIFKDTLELSTLKRSPSNVKYVINCLEKNNTFKNTLIQFMIS